MEVDVMSIMQEPEAAAAAEPLAPKQVACLAVAAAVMAPSVHNTQPWWFSDDQREISVHADLERRLDVADPSGREMLISCGAALFNIRVALRHLGYVPAVSIPPELDRPGLVARVRWGERVPAVEYEEQLFAEVERRRTHRDTFPPDPLPAGLLPVLCEEAVGEGATLCARGRRGAAQPAAGAARATRVHPYPAERPGPPADAAAVRGHRRGAHERAAPRWRGAVVTAAEGTSPGATVTTGRSCDLVIVR
jgi:hypothetical protein